MLKEMKRLDSSTTIRKDIEVAKRPMQLVELNKGLNLRQQRFFNLAILKAKNGLSEISKSDFDEIFHDTSDKFYSADVVNDVKALGSLGLLSGEGRSVTWDSVFIRVQYDDKNSVYRFEWSPYMKERIENVRKNYIQQDLKTLAHFKNKYSFIWYDYFKTNYRQWKWILAKEEIIKLLRLEGKKSYIENPSMMFKHCIETPINELNEHTEFKITIVPIRQKNKITAYEFSRYTEQGIELSATSKQIATLQEIVNRYGDAPLITREIANLAIYDAEAVPYLIGLFYEIQSFKNLIEGADKFTSESFKDIVALAIQKDNAFKAKFNEVRTRIQERPTIDVFLENKEQHDKPKSEFYNWLEERE